MSRRIKQMEGERERERGTLAGKHFPRESRNICQPNQGEVRPGTDAMCFTWTFLLTLAILLILCFSLFTRSCRFSTSRFPSLFLSYRLSFNFYPVRRFLSTSHCKIFFVSQRCSSLYSQKTSSPLFRSRSNRTSRSHSPQDSDTVYPLLSQNSCILSFPLPSVWHFVFLRLLCLETFPSTLSPGGRLFFPTVQLARERCTQLLTRIQDSRYKMPCRVWHVHTRHPRRVHRDKLWKPMSLGSEFDNSRF